MTYFTFERRGLRGGEQTFDGGIPVGEVISYKPWRERLGLNDRPARYVAKLPSGACLPGEYTSRHAAAEALRDHFRQDQGQGEQEMPTGA